MRVSEFFYHDEREIAGEISCASGIICTSIREKTNESVSLRACPRKEISKGISTRGPRTADFQEASELLNASGVDLMEKSAG